MTWIIAGISLLALASVLLPQQATYGQNAADKDKEPEIPKPRQVNFTTEDGVELSAFYLAGHLKKEAMPVIMLHGWKEKSGVMAGLALRIQREGHAVLVPDLRGHGKSTIQVPTKLNGLTDMRELNLDKFTKIDITAMNWDVKACKEFLMERHNAGECNIEKLCLVGSEMGALVTLNWAVKDWRTSRSPFLRLGLDIKTMILISPPQSFKGLTVQEALNHPIICGNLNTLLIVGSGKSSSLSAAKRLYNRMEAGGHGSKPDNPARLKDHRLFMVELDTASQGSTLLGEKNLKPVPEDFIWKFLRSKIVERETLSFAGKEFNLEWKRRLKQADFER
jgi:hypothetical protein